MSSGYFAQPPRQRAQCYVLQSDRSAQRGLEHISPVPPQVRDTRCARCQPVLVSGTVLRTGNGIICADQRSRRTDRTGSVRTQGQRSIRGPSRAYPLGQHCQKTRRRSQCIFRGEAPTDSDFARPRIPGYPPTRLTCCCEAICNPLPFTFWARRKPDEEIVDVEDTTLRQADATASHGVMPESW